MPAVNIAKDLRKVMDADVAFASARCTFDEGLD
jgi:hypothetical protein